MSEKLCIKETADRLEVWIVRWLYFMRRGGDPISINIVSSKR